MAIKPEELYAAFERVFSIESKLSGIERRPLHATDPAKTEQLRAEYAQLTSQLQSVSMEDLRRYHRHVSVKMLALREAERESEDIIGKLEQQLETQKQEFENEILFRVQCASNPHY